MEKAYPSDPHDTFKYRNEEQHFVAFPRYPIPSYPIYSHPPHHGILRNHEILLEINHCDSYGSYVRCEQHCYEMINRLIRGREHARLEGDKEWLVLLPPPSKTMSVEEYLTWRFSGMFEKVEIAT